MSRRIELDPCTRLTTGAVGQPGQRTFYLQGRSESVLVTLHVEKQQVAALSELIDQLLEEVWEGAEEDEAAGPDAPDLEEPMTPEFRVGRISLEYDEGRGLAVLECEEFVPTGEDDEPLEGAPEPAVVRFHATAEQMRALGRKGAEAVAGGRPICPMCGGPIDPEEHFCPSSNGHRPGDETE